MIVRKTIFKRTAIIIIAVGALALVTIIGLMTPSSGKATVHVSAGDGTIIISNKLNDDGAIRSTHLFRLAAVITGTNSHWKVGTYNIKNGSSYFSICHELTKPSAAAIRVTIPEGKQVRQIATILSDAGVCSRKEFLNACKTHSYDYEFLKGIPTSKRIGGLEGYLFPDTYFFDKNEDVDTVIRTMLDRFQEQVYTKEIRKAVKKSDLNFDQTIILASMVESEAATKKDRRLVAGIFLNRLSHPDQFPKLQSCVTVEYAKGIKKDILSDKDIKYDSPYNTYLHAGLPYGPICCPSLESIEAVIHPTKSSYYYFQSDSSGKLHYARTFKEHAKAQKKIQKNWS